MKTTPLTHYKEMRERADRLFDAVETLERYLPESTIRSVQAATNKACDQALQAFNELMRFRRTCRHNWVSDGHDSHCDWEKCTICEETRSV